MRPFVSVSCAVIGVFSVGGAVQAQKLENRGKLELELGAARVLRNDVRIPGDTGTRFDLRELLGGGSFAAVRVNVSYDINRWHGFRVLYAPFQVSGTGNLSSPVRFEDGEFAAGVPTEGVYKFNSYRLTYWYRVRNTPRSDWRVGVTFKIRDAKISLRQGALYADSTDLGFVPLLHVYGEERLSSRWGLIFDFDGLAAPQGRAFDVALKGSYRLSDAWELQGGYRVLEGGADNDRVYNFALVGYVVGGVGWRF